MPHYLIPTTPPDIYPYNLDPNRVYISIDPIPDSDVDWVVLEFRKNLLDSAIYYKTCFVKKDGSLVDIDGASPVYIKDFDNSDDKVGGEYYIAIRHRNHLTIVTDKAIAVFPENQNTIYDFTNPNLIMGKSQALKIVDIDRNGAPKYAMIAGWNSLKKDGEEVIDLFDRTGSWDNINNTNYNIYDFNMDGIITTRDYNVSWNNRLRFGFLR
jgi:hypothetical protein